MKDAILWIFERFETRLSVSGFPVDAESRRRVCLVVIAPSAMIAATLVS